MTYEQYICVDIFWKQQYKYKTIIKKTEKIWRENIMLVYRDMNDDRCFEQYLDADAVVMVTDSWSQSSVFMNE